MGKYCRLCLKADLWDSPLPIFVEGLDKKITAVIGLAVRNDDKLPAVICHLCLAKVEFISVFKKEVEDSCKLLSGLVGAQDISEEVNGGAGTVPKKDDDARQRPTTSSPLVSTTHVEPVKAARPDAFSNAEEKARPGGGGHAAKKAPAGSRKRTASPAAEDDRPLNCCDECPFTTHSLPSFKVHKKRHADRALKALRSKEKAQAAAVQPSNDNIELTDNRNRSPKGGLRRRYGPASKPNNTSPSVKKRPRKSWFCYRCNKSFNDQEALFTHSCTYASEEEGEKAAKGAAAKPANPNPLASSEKENDNDDKQTLSNRVKRKMIFSTSSSSDATTDTENSDIDIKELINNEVDAIQSRDATADNAPVGKADAANGGGDAVDAADPKPPSSATTIKSDTIKKCNQCGQSFASMKELVMHKRKHKD